MLTYEEWFKSLSDQYEKESLCALYCYLQNQKIPVTLSLKQLPRSINAGTAPIESPLTYPIVSGVIDKVYAEMLYFTYESSTGKTIHLYIKSDDVISIAYEDTEDA